MTVVSNGFLAGNELNEILEIYMDELVGQRVYDQSPDEFPILVKLIDARDWLSVQVHPDDALAAERGIGRGKTEMWYILDAEPGASLISGFSKHVDRAAYLEALAGKRLKEVLNVEEVHKGDVFHIPAGRIHALGPGIMLAEIQQTSDTTWRIYDWDRTDDQGRSRELHTELALDAIDFSAAGEARTRYRDVLNRPATLVDCDHFTVTHIHADRETEKDYSDLDSFVIYLAVEGKGLVRTDAGEVEIRAGETVLIPASVDTVTLVPLPETRILEVCIP